MANADRIIELLHEAKALSPGSKREQFLTEACGNDSALKEQLVSLLRADAEGDSDFLKNTLLLRPTALVSEKPGDKIGRYKLLEQIGEGGCGVVYMAEQEEPVRRRVALKVIKLGMDTKQVIARFEAERQALALMDHPNIAKVLDAGATETGRPFFVMELVRGIRITDYCDQNNLSTTERLELFIQVCQAIQHAHQKGIIHRDIKPSNILVTQHDDVAVPKVIDFGIAKATTGQLTDKTLFTAFAQFIGTPAYMSPEQTQMSGLDIDTRADIYSLGVLLYELLTGNTPFDAQELLAAGLDEMRRKIREDEPLRPSTCLSTMQANHLTTVAKLRHEEAPKLIHLMRGDLDWLVMKCLEKDRTRRYETANALAMDVQRHLNNEPVVACPPSNLYRFQKLVRRNKLTVAAGATVGLALILGTVVSTWQALRAIRSERDQVRLRDSEAVQRHRAEASELVARQNLYAADLNLAQQDYNRGHIGSAQKLLAAHQPAPGQEDLRGFEWRYLWNATRGDHFAILRGHSNVVSALAISPDGKIILSGSQDRTVRLWDFASRKLISTLPMFSGMVISAAFSPDGKLFAVGAATGVTLWNTERREFISRLNTSCSRVAFSPVGNLLAAGTTTTFFERDGVSVTLFDYTTGKELAKFPTGGSRAIFSQDGKMLALSGRNDSVRLIDVKTLKEVGELPNGDTVISLAFTHDGAKLLVAYWGGETRVWDLATQRVETSLKGHTSRVWCMAFSPDQQTLATASSDQTVRLWDVSTWRPKKVLLGHANEVWNVAFTPDGRTLVTSSKDETLRLSYAQISQWANEIGATQGRSIISRNGLSLATAGEDGQTALWDVVASRKVGAFDGSPAGFVDEGKTLVTLSLDGTLMFWNVTDQSARSKTTLMNNRHPIDWATLSPDGRILVVQTALEPLRFFDAMSGKSLGTIPKHTGGASTLAFSPDSRFVATPYVGRVNVFDSASLQLVATDFKHKMDTDTCAFSRDGKFIATGSADGTITISDFPRMNSLCRLTGHKEGITSVVFSPDGKTLVSSSDDKSVKFWNVSTFREMITFDFTNKVDSLFFSEDGGMLAMAGQGQPLKIFRAPSCAEIAAAENAIPD